MKTTLRRLLFVLALYCVPAHADTISYTVGIVSLSTTISLQADSNPAVLEFGNGGFDFAFSDFSYLQNGSPVGMTPTFVRFFTAANGGGFEICFNGTTVANCTDGVGNITFGPQLYNGPNSAPTLLTGAFTFDQGNIGLEARAVPEPSTLLILTTGLLALGGLRLFIR
jgi:hypothetical protein